MRLNVKYLNDTERKAKKNLYPEKFDIIAKTYINRCNYHLIKGYKETAKKDYEKAVDAANTYGCTFETESNIDWMYKNFYYVNTGSKNKNAFDCNYEELILKYQDLRDILEDI